MSDSDGLGGVWRQETAPAEVGCNSTGHSALQECPSCRDGAGANGDSHRDRLDKLLVTIVTSISCKSYI